MGRAPKKPHEALFDGLEADLRGVIIRFIATESVRYEEFAKIWRALNFPLIFYGIKSDQLVRTLTSEAFALAASSLIPPHDLQTRICAMYLLYGLYYTQPCSPKVKIRMDPEHWQALMNLSKEIKDQGHLDAAYIFLKMHNDKIFQFTATLRHASYTRHKTGDGEYEKWRAGKELMTTTFKPDLLEQLHGIHNHYQQMKQDMGLHDNLSMKLVRDSMADYIIQRIHAHQASDDEDEESEQEREANPAQERAARIAMIKNKSFTSKGKGSSSQRHLQEAATSASELDEKPSVSSSGKPGRRGRRKVKKMPGRKPVERDRPATEMEKKKAWSILPMRRLIDVEEEREDHDEDSDVELHVDEKKRKKKKAAIKPSRSKGGKGKKSTEEKQEKEKKKQKKNKKKKKKRRESETDKSTAETSGEDRSEMSGSATSGLEDFEASPRKLRGRKRKRGSSTSEAEIDDGKRRRRKKGKKSGSDGQTDEEMGWIENDGDEMSSSKGESPQKGESPGKGKSPKGKTRISVSESDGKSLHSLPETLMLARSEGEESGMETISLRRKRRGRPKKSVMPEEDVTAWRSISDDNCHEDGGSSGLVSDGGASTGTTGQVNTGVRVDVRTEKTEHRERPPQEPSNRPTPKKVLLGVKKTGSQKNPVGQGSGGKEQVADGGKDLKEKVVKTPPRTRKRKELEEQRDTVSPRKSSRSRKVVKY